MTLQLALDLAALNLYVFPCRAEPETITVKGEKRTYAPKSAIPHDGFYSGTTDPATIKKMWAKHPNALVGVWAGASGIVALDIDVKRNDAGDIVVDGYESLDDAWLAVPDTFSYTTTGGEGTHKIYSDPKTGSYGPASGYRGMAGIDRRAGGSYVVWAGPIPASRDEFTESPEWLLDPGEVRSVAAFEGSLQEWYDTLEAGEPNIPVRSAINRVKDDFSHSEMVSAQHEAVRLGAEGNPGVPQLLARLEEAWLNRPGENHTTPESQWEFKFVEALQSGVEKYGETITLRQDMPEYSPAILPVEVPDSLVTGVAGDKHDFNALLRALTNATEDDLLILSILWSASRTRDLAREWGLLFTYKRVMDARKVAPPVTENPTLEPDDFSVADAPEEEESEFLTPEQRELVRSHPSFVDEYIAASYAAKGWVNRDYVIPAAWTVLSMAFGFRAFLPVGKNIPVNLWFITMGYSGTGKSVSFHEMRTCLDLLYKDGEGAYYNIGANSSPEAMHEALLDRDRKPSAIIHDEASGFFENIQRKDWMAGSTDLLADWYDGYVHPVNKVRLKELKGKSAHTSFNLGMVATPDRMLKYLSTSMFESGFLARVNWTWGEAPDDSDEREFLVSRSTTDEVGINPVWYDVVNDLLAARKALGDKPIAMDWTEEAEDLIILAHMKMKRIAQGRDNYSSTEPAIKRMGKETLWKCAALNALYQGRTVIEEIDALVAIYYAQRWFETMFRVVDAAGQGEFAARLTDIETYIGRYPNGVTEPRVFDRFKHFAKFSARDVDNLVEYLVRSGRIVLERGDSHKPTKYRLNGGKVG